MSLTWTSPSQVQSPPHMYKASLSPSPPHNILRNMWNIENTLFFAVDSPANGNEEKREQLLAFNVTRYIPPPIKSALKLLFRKKPKLPWKLRSRFWLYLRNEWQKSTSAIILTCSDIEFATLHFHQPFDVAMIKEQAEESTGITNIPGSSFHYSFIHGYTYFSLFFNQLGPEPAFGRLGLGGLSGGYISHGYTSHASLRAFRAQLGADSGQIVSCISS